MHGFAHVVLVFRAEIARRHYVHAAAQTDEEAGEERDERGRRADGAERVRADEPADRRNIGHVEEHLQNIGKHQRNAEAENLPRERALRQVLRIVRHGVQSSFFLRRHTL